MNYQQNINTILSSFKIGASCVDYSEYKNASFYDLKLSPGARIKQIEKFLPEISLLLKEKYKPNLKSLPDQGLVRLEFLRPRKEERIDLFELGYKLPRPKGKLTCLLGETPEGTPLWMDLAENPHTLIAGTTGSGKSTLLHSIIANLLLYPQTSILLFDPKNIEFAAYSKMKSNKIQVSFDYEECLTALKVLVDQMDQRYQKMREDKKAKFPYIILIIDEFADLIQQDTNKRFYDLLCRLSQKSRAAGIHLILSTQRPSVDIIDGTIKANFPARIACKTATNIDSRVILDTPGAQNLMGRGDAIIKSASFDMQRFQTAFTTAQEVITCLDR